MTEKLLPCYQKCPKCDGQGIVSKPPWVAGDVHEWVSTPTSFICDVCHGTKVLQVPSHPAKRSVQEIAGEIDREICQCCADDNGDRIPCLYCQVFSQEDRQKLATAISRFVYGGQEEK